MSRILVTGAAGFSGSHVVEELLRDPQNYVFILDRLTYAGRLSGLAHLPKDRLKFIYHDFKATLPDWMIERYGYAKARRIGHVAMVGGKDKQAKRNRSPTPFRDLLLSMAATVQRENAE